MSRRGDSCACSVGVGANAVLYRLGNAGWLNFFPESGERRDAGLSIDERCICRTRSIAVRFALPGGNGAAGVPVTTLELFSVAGISPVAVCMAIDVSRVGAGLVLFANSLLGLASVIFISGLSAVTGAPDTGLLGDSSMPSIDVTGACLLLHFALLGGGVGVRIGSSGSGMACSTNCPLSRVRDTTLRFRSSCPG